MRKFLFVFALSASLLCSDVFTGTAEAGRGGSSGGRSFSSGSSSHGRSYSSGSSTSGRSYSSGARSSGKSYSSASSTSKPPSGSARPPATSPSSRTNPSSPSIKAGPSSAPASTNPNRPPAVNGSSSSGKSYSSGSQSSSSGPIPGPAAMPSGNGSPTGRSYSSGNGSLSGKSYSTPNGSSKPAAGPLDASAARSQKMAESKVAFQKGQQPKESYTDRGGVRHSIDPNDRHIESLRRELNYERWENRQWRQRQFFGSYYSYPPVVVYHDPYSSFFWWWLLDRSLDDRAYWAYHHRQSIDEARYQEMLRRDANLEARIHQLEAQNIPRDPTYRPNNIDPDLMYSDPYVEAVYNPQPTVTTPSATVAPIPRRHVSSREAYLALFTVFGVLVMIALVIWLVFYKRWGSIGG